MDDILQVELLEPPLFTRTGKVVDRRLAWKDGLWYGTFNLWVYQTKPFPAIVYQQRSPNIGWAPSKLDVCVAGHIENGRSLEEEFYLECKEEMKKEWDFAQTTFIGRKLSVGKGAFDNSVRNSVINILAIEDNSPISTYFLQKKEVYGICVCPIDKLLKVHEDKNFSFEVDGLRNDNEPLKITVSQDIFPENWDPYHYKMAVLLDRIIRGEKIAGY